LFIEVTSNDELAENTLQYRLLHKLLQKNLKRGFKDFLKIQTQSASSLEQRHQLLGRLGDVEGALDHLLCHEVLVERLLLRPEGEGEGEGGY
jgi:hypothetical protein